MEERRPILTTKLFGPPGTGKTTTLLTKVEEALAAGINPEEIGYISFTNKAATEAATRAIARFKLPASRFPWFRTMHSLAFKVLELTTQSVMKKEHYSDICEKLGLEYSGYISMDEGLLAGGALEGDRMLFNEGLARVRMIDPFMQYNLSDEEYSLPAFNRFCQTVTEYKQSLALVDFNDMLEMFIDEPELCPSFKLLLIDEAQDLSRLQWKMAHILMRNSDTVYVAGDDDQAIYVWAGADPDGFTSLQGNSEVLAKSYRLNNEVHSVAQRISNRLQKRVRKDFSSNGETGQVRYISDPYELVDYLDNKDSGSWLILARNAYLLKEFEELFEQNGYAYSSKKSPLNTDIVGAIVAYEKFRKGEPVNQKQANVIAKYYPRFNVTKPGDIWHKEFTRLGRDIKDYFIAALRREESLTKTPRITLSTIHGAKGGEADNVVLVRDMSYKSYTEYQDNPDLELRVFYVAVTRAIKNLYLLEPKTPYFFDV
jgi:superfamily I DNA/RNA helicase